MLQPEQKGSINRSKTSSPRFRRTNSSTDSSWPCHLCQHYIPWENKIKNSCPLSFRTLHLTNKIKERKEDTLEEEAEYQAHQSQPWFCHRCSSSQRKANQSASQALASTSHSTTQTEVHQDPPKQAHPLNHCPPAKCKNQNYITNNSTARSARDTLFLLDTLLIVKNYWKLQNNDKDSLSK